MTTTSIRTFIAIDLAPAVRQSMTQTITKLKSSLESNAIRWVKPENVHLTLQFLGNNSIATVPQITDAMERVALKFGPFELSLDRLGCFPNARRPRIIWIGVKGEQDILYELQHDLAEALVSLGWDPEQRPYHPHLTLGRVKKWQTVSEQKIPWDEPVDQTTINVDSFCLFESQLNPSGAVYSVLHTTRL